MRQQFATTINVQIARYAADFVNRLGAEFPPDECVPDPRFATLGTPTYLIRRNSQGC